jgi:soluble lytic murein transglycosylase
VKIRRSFSLAFIGFLLILHVLPWTKASPSWSVCQTPEEEFERGLALYKGKDYGQALETFQHLLEEYPASPSRPDTLFMQGHTLRALESWAEAAQVFSRAAEVHLTLADYALYFQGEALQMGGEGDKSLEVFKTLVTLHPKSLLVPQAELKIVELFFQRGEYLRGVEVCENLLRGSPKKDYPAQALFFLGQARENLEQWADAIKTYQELWLKYPLHPLAKNAKARWDSLAQEKKLAVEKIPAEALFRRSVQFYQAQLYEAALAEMGRLEGFPPHAYPDNYAGERWVDDLYFQRGMCFFRLKQYAKAAEAFNLMVRQSRINEMAEKSLFWMTQSLFRLDQKEEALNALALLQSRYPRGALVDQALYLKARIFQEQEDLPQAISLYRQVAEKFPQSSLRFPAMWQSGWLLYRSQDGLGAIQAWDGLLALNPNSPWTEKALYWKGKVLEEMGKRKEAGENYQQLRKSYAASCYTQLAAARGCSFMSEKKTTTPLQDQSLSPFFEGRAQALEGKNLNLEKGRLLVRLGLQAMAVGELEAAEEEGRADSEMWMDISRLYRELGEHHRSAILIRKKMKLRPLADRPTGKERTLYLLAYPLGNSSWINHYAQNRNLDPALLSAVILEESRFNPQAISSAGARGLMQVLPSTANQIIQRIKVRPYSDELLFDPETNLRLGSWYLSSLWEEFKGKETLALAAYNAGPNLVREWMAKNPAAGEDEFVENIPYPETRNYVIRVLSSAQVYRLLYGASENPEKP